MDLVKVETYLAAAGEYRVVDVRTAEEHAHGSIPDSINIPIFDQQQRAHIGAIYQRSPRAARFAAMDLLSPRLPLYIRRIHRNCHGLTPLIVCWRGGMRSGFTIRLLQMAGVRALQLEGGYRAYRRWAYNQLQNFQLDNPLLVLKGKTGTGKTALLQVLGQMGLPVLDLEALAGHRGSAFGGFGDKPASSQKDFDARLLLQLEKLKGNQPILVEGESKRIGNIYLPDFFFRAMRKAPVIETSCSLEIRVNRILKEYTPITDVDVQRIYAALGRLQGRLPVKLHAQLEDSLKRENYAVFVRLLLEMHYDNVYDFQMPGKNVLLAVDTEDIKKAAMAIAAQLANPNFPV